jgi:SAM-dependent methyltransferase
MGAGCGTFVHYALRQNLDAFGIEPESWKLEVIRRKVKQYGYDRSWAQRIIAGKGESLPFADESFDCVTTYQTLEHVQDVHRCCSEMLRVTRRGGGIHIRCPDYELSTFEGHYRLPWIPGLWGRTAERYLALRRRPVAGLRTLQPVSARILKRLFARAGNEQNRRLRIVNVDYFTALNVLHLRDNLFGYVCTRPVMLAHFLRHFLRTDTVEHLFIHVANR